MPIILNTDLGAESKVLKKYVPNVQGANCLLTQMDRKVISGLCYNRCKQIVQWKSQGSPFLKKMNPGRKRGNHRKVEI